MERRVVSGSLEIALVLEPSGGGSGRHVLDLAEGLVAHGHAVTVVWSPVRAQVEFSTRLTELRDVKNLTLEMHRAVGPADISSLRAMAALLRDHGPFDVLHGHSSKAGALVRLLPRQIPGVRIYTPHAFRTMDPELGVPGKWAYGLIERMLAPRADRIITVSAAEHRHATALAISAERLKTVVNGAALPASATRSLARKAMGLVPGDVAVGFIGRLDAQKAPLCFIEAATAAANTAPMLRAIVIGDGSLRAAAEARDTAGVARFMGWQDGPALFPGLDIFCMTSQYEAMPYTLLEAVLAGVPIVTSAVGGVEETVRDGENGYVLSIGSSAEAFAERLSILVNDPDMRRAFSDNAHDVAENVTLAGMCTQTLAVYKDALRSA